MGNNQGSIMTFDEFKKEFPWVFRPSEIKYHVNTNEEVYTNLAGEDTVIRRVEVSINSNTPNGELTASVTLTPRDATVFIDHMMQHLDTKGVTK